MDITKINIFVSIYCMIASLLGGVQRGNHFFFNPKPYLFIF